MTTVGSTASPPTGAQAPAAGPYARRAPGVGSAGRLLGAGELDAFLEEHLLEELGSAERVLVLVPDRTRTAPVAEVARLVRRLLDGRVKCLDYLVALGTHAPLSLADRLDLVGLGQPGGGGGGGGGATVANHRYDDPEQLVEVGELSAAELHATSGGRLDLAVPVRINRMVLDYDRILVCSPVLPHEVVGFSGGNKYLFPGIGAPELIDVSHWLGALITSRATIGRLGVSPVRALIDAGASLVPVARTCLALVTGRAGGLHGAFLGDAEPAWAAAAELSAEAHVERLDQPVERVLSVVPARYPDMWTAAKAMYKLEPVVADGGEVVVYAPHVRELSSVHGEQLARVGYHVRDWHLARWEQLQDVPWRVLAHSTQLKGDGTYDARAGEQPRIRVRLATSIPERTCREHALGYLDPRAVAAELAAPSRAEGTFVAHDAGETLYRLTE